MVVVRPVVDMRIPEGLIQRTMNIRSTIPRIPRGKLRNHLSLILEDILPKPLMMREAQNISKNQPIKELIGVQSAEIFGAGTWYPVKNDNP
jgi:hypothetical protein